MKLNDFLKAVGYSVVEGGKSSFDYYPDDARYIEHETKAGFATAHYDPVTLEVYEAYVSDLLNREHYYIWVHPDYRIAKGKYQKSIGYESEHTPTDSEEDILFKIEAILNNRTFDDTVVMEFDLADDVYEILENMAIEQNITFDKLVENAIVKYIEDLKRT